MNATSTAMVARRMVQHSSNVILHDVPCRLANQRSLTPYGVTGGIVGDTQPKYAHCALGE